MFKSDTIAAIATALSDAGIGIIRISGPDAIAIANRIFINKDHKHVFSTYETHTLHYGFIIDSSSADEKIIDEVMISLMKTPNSYTREDTVEINCHGGVLMVQKVLQTVLSAGARLAEPGEFTKRAFLNGRIDLSKAEAVMDVIHSRNELALSNSVKLLRGKLFQKMSLIRNSILYETAFIESALDDPEHISLDGYPDKLRAKCDDILEELNDLLRSFDQGRLLTEGISTVIVGKPNAGKSSVLNAILGEDRAIVTSVAGTTRDALHETIHIGSVTLNMIDTAGIHDSIDPVEQIGIQKAKNYADQADLVLYVIDGSTCLDENDADIIKMIRSKKVIVLVNKSDLKQIVSDQDISDLFDDKNEFVSYRGEEDTDSLHDEVLKLGGQDIYLIHTSVTDDTGIDTLSKLIEVLFFRGIASYNDDVILTNLRQKNEVSSAITSIQNVINSIEMMMPEDFYTIDLMDAYSLLGKITGDEVGEDLVNEIFSKFCMGK